MLVSDLDLKQEVFIHPNLRFHNKLLYDLLYQDSDR